jgi:hypothetical protein
VLFTGREDGVRSDSCFLTLRRLSVLLCSPSDSVSDVEYSLDRVRLPVVRLRSPAATEVHFRVEEFRVWCPEFVLDSGMGVDCSGS